MGPAGAGVDAADGHALAVKADELRALGLGEHDAVLGDLGAAALGVVVDHLELLLLGGALDVLDDGVLLVAVDLAHVHALVGHDLADEIDRRILSTKANSSVSKGRTSLRVLPHAAAGERRVCALP